MPETIRRKRIKDALVALSLAFLLFVRVWNALLNQNYNQYFSDITRNRFDYLGAVANTLLVAALIFWAGRGVRRGVSAPTTNAGWVAMLAALLPLADFVRRLAAHRYASFDLIGTWEIVTCAVIFVLVGLLFRRWVVRAVYVGALALSPFVLIVLLNALFWGIAGTIRAKTGLHAAFADPKPSKHRVIWLIFDELDQRVAFEARPPGLALPALDRFRGQSLYADSAYPPAGLTFLSIPSMLSGRVVDRARVKNTRELMVGGLGDPQEKPFPSQATPFNELQADGYRVAVLGWFFPYDRMFPRSETCFSRSFAFPQTQGYTGDSLVASMGWQYVFCFAPPLLRGRFREVFEQLHAATLEVIESPTADLIYAHYSIPHYPGVARGGEANAVSVWATGPKAYFGNLSLVDRAVADIVAAVRRSGIAEQTTIILTADHWWRAAPMYDARLDHRVPLLVRSPAKVPTAFEPSVNNVHIVDLVRDILRGRAVDNESVRAILEQHAEKKAYRFGGGGQMLP